MEKLFDSDIELLEPEHRYTLKSEPEIEKNVIFDSPAIALAR